MSCWPAVPGTGGPSIATALGVQAIEQRRKRVRFFFRVEPAIAVQQERARGHAGQIAGRLAQSDLVILDEPGNLQVSASGGALLFHLLNKHHERPGEIVGGLPEGRPLDGRVAPDVPVTDATRQCFEPHRLGRGSPE